MKKFLTITFICFPLLILFCSGCGSSKPALGKVEGTVTLDGQPLKKGNIIFTTKGARDAFGIIENGVIQRVTTFVEGDGAPVGQAAVAIIAVKETENKPLAVNVSDTADPSTPTTDNSVVMSGEEFLVPIHYTNPETSGLTATIQKGINTLNFELKSN
ncbi:MAG: hypothetical protein LBT09_06355 [Planctomycetaceae bacterium]|jgi:hypothetical protein|nr:hypothetical protein [Planctomycetaceae bacterium]